MNNNRTKEVARQRRKQLINSRGNICARCGKKFPSPVFEFHHLDSERKLAKGVFSFRKFESMATEAGKCLMVCANCHRMIHSLSGPNIDLRFTDRFDASLAECD